MCDIALKAVLGRDGVFPFTLQKKFGEAQVGAQPFPKGLKFLNLDKRYCCWKRLADSSLFTPNRYRKMLELMREPLFYVNMEKELGGFKTKLPLVMAAMGSTDIANKRGIILAEGGRSGMSPTVALNCLGYPTLVCIKKIS
jgi:hypothetical protein